MYLEDTLIRGNIGSAEQCLRECKLKENVSGCMYNDEKECAFYTSPTVAKGSGENGIQCWKIEA